MAKTGTALLLALFLLMTVPFGFALIPVETSATTKFSIYNPGYDGLSGMKALIEEIADETGQTITIETYIGSANVLNRLEEENPGMLFIMGPGIHYDPTEAIAILMYWARGGNVLIADDFGTSNDILSVLSVGLGSLSSASAMGLPGFPFPIAGIAINKSLLCDNQNYIDNYVQPVLKAPTMEQGTTSVKVPAPWIEDYIEGITNGVVANYASCLSMKVLYPNPDTYVPGENVTDFITKWVPMGRLPATISEFMNMSLGFEVTVELQIAALYSSEQSWMESNTVLARDHPEALRPDRTEWGGREFPVFMTLPFGDIGDLLTGIGDGGGGIGDNGSIGFPENATFLGSLSLCSDPSIFTNQYLSQEFMTGFGTLQDNPYYNEATDTWTYDNYLFAKNFLTKNLEGRGNITVIFDEGHLAPSGISPNFYLGLFFRLLDMITMFPLICWIVPLVVLASIPRFIPKKAVTTPLLMTRVEQYYGRSFFAIKMRWFLEYQQYNRGLELLYRRLRRTIIRRYSLDERGFSPQIAAEVISSEFPDLTYQEIEEQFTIIEQTISSGMFVTEQEFLDGYLFIKGITDHIS